jgi:hypothetical protein
VTLVKPRSMRAGATPGVDDRALAPVTALPNIA